MTIYYYTFIVSFNAMFSCFLIEKCWNVSFQPIFWSVVKRAWNSHHFRLSDFSLVSVFVFDETFSCQCLNVWNYIYLIVSNVRSKFFIISKCLHTFETEGEVRSSLTLASTPMVPPHLMNRIPHSLYHSLVMRNFVARDMTKEVKKTDKKYRNYRMFLSNAKFYWEKIIRT